MSVLRSRERKQGMRLAVLFWAVALAFGMLHPAAAAEMPSVSSADKPVLTVEGNAVFENGHFTGYFELALRVQTDFYFDAAGNPVSADAPNIAKTVSHKFVSAAVALRYDPEILTPVSWDYAEKPADVPGDPPTVLTGRVIDVPTTVNRMSPVSLPTKKVDDNITMSAQVVGYDTTAPAAVLSLYAEAPEKGVSYPKDIILGVVRFKYDTSKINMDKAETGFQYLWAKDAPDHMDGNPASGSTPATPDKDTVVYLAKDAEAYLTNSGQSAWYHGLNGAGENVYFYYYNGSETDTPSLTTPPNTKGMVVKTGEAGKEYTSNLMKAWDGTAPVNGKAPGDLVFKLDNRGSYTAGGVDLNNLVTILFYDWDDSLIGTLTVERGDAREAVNKYVEEKMVHPDLHVDAGKYPANKLMNSLDREYTYRGAYPYTVGGGAGQKDPTGEKYPLTNKLDYAFYRRPTAKTENPAFVDPEGETVEARLWEVSENDPADKCYPYVNGWAVVEDIKNLENVWTTFGVGELEDQDPKAAAQTDNSVTPAASYHYATYGESDYFDLADFASLGDLPEEQKVLYVKAVYEEGTDLEPSAQYTHIGGVTYTRTNTVSSTESGNAYSLSFQYGRVDPTYTYGVKRTRDPSVRVQYTTDDYGLAGTQFYIEGIVKNVDVMDVEITPSAGILSMTYMLGDVYGQNSYVTADRRSIDGNELEIPTNFIYEADADYNERQGTDGFVYRATLYQVLQYGTKAAMDPTDSQAKTDFENLLTATTFADLNLQKDETTSFTSMLDVMEGQAMLLDAIQKAYNAGVTDDNGVVALDWHQLQYHILHYNDGSGGIASGGGIMTPLQCIVAYSAEHTGGFTWCRYDDCAGGSVAGAINTIPEMLEAAYKVYKGTDASALEVLMLSTVNGFDLRANLKGDAYTDLAVFKAKLLDAIKALTDPGTPYAGGTNLSNVTWYELQYALHNGTYLADASIPKADYWWKGDAPTISTLADLLTVSYKVYGDGYDAAYLGNLSMGLVDSLYLRASESGVKFKDLTEFKAALKDAVLALKAAGITDANVASVGWDVFQNLLAGNPYSATPTASFWWDGGGTKPIDNLRDLMDAAWLVYGDASVPDALDGLELTKVNGAPLWLRATSDGDEFADLPAALAALDQATSTLAGAGFDASGLSGITWLQYQHFMLGNGYKSNGALENDPTIQYWWKDGQSKPGGDTPGIDLDAEVTKLTRMVTDIEWYSTGTSDDLTAAVSAVIADLGLQDKNGNTYGASDVATLNAELSGALAALGGIADFTEYLKFTDADGAYMELTWNELQYFILNGSLTEDSATPDYSWKPGGGGGDIPTPPSIDLDAEVTKLTRMVTDIEWYNTGTGDDLTAAVSAVVADLGLQDKSGNTYSASDVAALNAELSGALATLGGITDFDEYLKFTDADGAYMELTWNELQYFIINGSLTEDSTTPEYSWKPGGSGGGDITTPPSIDLDVEVTKLTRMVTDIEWYNTGTGDDLTAAVSAVVADLGLQDKSGNTYGASDVAALNAELSGALATLGGITDFDEYLKFTDADGAYMELTWKEFQYFILHGTLKEDSTITDADLTPASLNEVPLEELPVTPEEVPPEVPVEPEVPTEPDVPMEPEVPGEDSVGGGVPDTPPVEEPGTGDEGGTPQPPAEPEPAPPSGGAGTEDGVPDAPPAEEPGTGDEGETPQSPAEPETAPPNGGADTGDGGTDAIPSEPEASGGDSVGGGVPDAPPAEEPGTGDEEETPQSPAEPETAPPNGGAGTGDGGTPEGNDVPDDPLPGDSPPADETPTTADSQAEQLST